ncbi:SPFH/Band 7/PHB domain protein [bacterium]|nr:SPFH/Band 7/PHB domain protein [bacterium]
MFGVIFTVVLVLAILVFIQSVKIIRQAQVMIIERLGVYHRTLSAGFNLIIPFFDVPKELHVRTTVRGIDGRHHSINSLTPIIDLREMVFDFPPQKVITKDNVTITIDALLYYQIIDSTKAVYAIANLPEAIEKLTQTTLRNVIGEMELDATLVSRDQINEKLRTTLDSATDKWGVKVNRVELKDINPPREIQDSMEKQMKAERDRRATILEAEGQKKAAILEAEGYKESLINKAEGEKQSAVLVAEGEAIARVKQAQGEASAIKQVIEAIAGNGQPDKYLIAMKYLETLKGISSGQNNKVVYMPYEATGVLSSIDGIKEMLNAKQ